MIAWNRICRPGSVLGPQQHFINQMEAKLLPLPSKIAAGLGIGDVTDKMKVSDNKAKFRKCPLIQKILQEK